MFDLVLHASSQGATILSCHLISEVSEAGLILLQCTRLSLELAFSFSMSPGVNHVGAF